MGTFKHNPVYKSVKNNMFYIQDQGKMIPKENLFTVIEYVGGDHAEVLYSKSHGASLNPKLAAEEFMDDRNRYFESHNMNGSKKLRGQGKKKGGESKQEILAHHIYISFDEIDSQKISVELLNDIMDEFLKAMKWDAYRSIQAPHLNTIHKHIHASICAYSRDGRKIHMKNATVYKAKIELNYICSKYGLSIIDDAKLYVWAKHNAPEYCEWFDQIKKNSTVRIVKNISLEEKKHREEERKAKRKVKATPPKDLREEIERVISYNNSKTKDCSMDYYAGGKFINPRKNKPYRMNLYDHSGRRRGTIELLLLLVAAMLIDTNRYAVENYCMPFSRHNEELQKVIDALTFTRECGITTPLDLEKKILDCRKQINSCKKAIERLEMELEKGKDDRLYAELQKHKGNLHRFRTNHGHLMKLTESVNETARGRYTYRTEEFVNKKAIEMAWKKKIEAENTRSLGIDQQIEKAEKQKGRNYRGWNQAREYESR